jgi:hypothetical protein
MFRMAQQSAQRDRASPAPSVSSVRSAPAAPQLASIERDRVMPQKRPATERQAVAGEHKRKETGISLAARVRQYPGEMLAVSAGELHCTACKQRNIQNIKSTIDTHVRSDSHKAAVAAARESKARDGDLRAELVTYYMSNPAEKGASTDPDTLAYRHLAVRTLLYAGIPLAKADDIRPLLERSGYAMTSADNLRPLVPKVEHMELLTLKQELEGQYISLAFDGTTRLGEAVNVVSRHVTHDFTLVHRLVRFVTLSQHATAADLAGFLTRMVVQQFGLSFDRVVGFLRDSAAVNGAAVRMLGMFPAAADVMCVSHTLNNTGGRLAFPNLGPFSSSWVTCMNSHNARNLWAQLIGHSPRRYSSVRWHALAEMQFEMATAFTSLDALLQQCEQLSIAPASVQQMSQILGTHRHELRCELAAMMDMKRLVAATYDLEGDRLEILLVHDRIHALMDVGRRLRQGDVDGLLPNLHAVLRADSSLGVGTVIDKLWPGQGVFEGRVDQVNRAQSDVHADGRMVTVYRVHYPADDEREELEDEEIRSLVRVRELAEHTRIVRDCLVPAFDYLDRRFADAHAAEQYSCAQQMRMFRALRVFNPSYAASIQLTSADVDALGVVLPIAHLCSLDALKAELPSFTAAVAGVLIPETDIAAFTEQVLAWWHSHAAQLPAWSHAARIAFALSPNSASCERVFSLLESMFGDTQMSALADYIQAALMLRYNGRRM